MRLIDADALDDVIQNLNEKNWGITRADYKMIDAVLFEFPTIEPLSAREAYIKGLADGIRECTEKLKKLKADMRGEGNGNE